jgi:hypothetical protein
MKVRVLVQKKVKSETIAPTDHWLVENISVLVEYAFFPPGPCWVFFKQSLLQVDASFYFFNIEKSFRKRKEHAL